MIGDITVANRFPDRALTKALPPRRAYDEAMVLRLETLDAPSPLCRTFEQLSSEVWTTLRDANFYKVAFGEESVTEMLLLALKRAHPNEIDICPFTRHSEAKNGADWAWWFKGRQWLGMRVQAKKLYADSRRYGSLDHKVGKSKKRQIDLLLSQAKKDNLYPMYCFYNFWDLSTHPLSNVSFNCRTFPRSEHRVGCTLAPADAVRLQAIDQGKDDLATVAQLSFPWICLICCPGGTANGDDLSSRVKASLQVQQLPVPSKVDGRRRPKQLVPVLVDEPPRYVLAAAHGDLHGTELPQGVAGVAVFKDAPREEGHRAKQP